MDQHQNSLELWRKDIRQIDDEILRLAAQRMELALKIGAYKQEHDLPVKDFKVERQIVEKARDQAQGMGLDPDFAEELMTMLIRFSVDRQGELHRNQLLATEPQAQNVLVIGGQGRMGQWFAQYYSSLGYTIWIHDKAEGATPYHWHADLSRDLDRYELVIVATPISVTNDVLKRLAELKPKGIVIETSSLKEPLKQGFEALQKKGVRLASLHPMFGPDTDLLVGLNILFCVGEGLCSEQIAHAHFKMTSARLVPIALKEHDKQMQYALALSHFLNFLHASIIRESGIPLQRLKETGGPSFMSQLQVTETIVQENASLSFDIQTQSSFPSDLLPRVQETIQSLGRLLQAGDKDQFLGKAREAREFFEKGR